MEYDTNRIDEATLALLYLVLWKDGESIRAWKSFDWDTMNRLHEKGWIHDPKGKAKSVLMTKEGLRKSEELFEKLFAL
jgi:hypothetical protein